MQSLPCRSSNGASVYRRNCRGVFNGRTFIVRTVRRGCFLLDLSHFCSLGSTKRRAMHIFRVDRNRHGIHARHSNNIYANAIYHLASALFFCASHKSCMICHDPDHWFASHAISGEPRDLRFNLIPCMPETCLITYTHRCVWTCKQFDGLTSVRYVQRGHWYSRRA